MKNISFDIICIHHHEREGHMKFEFPFQGLYEQIENVVRKIYFPLNVSFNGGKCDPQGTSHYSCQVIQLYLSHAWIKGFILIFPCLFYNDDSKNKFQVYRKYAFRLQRITRLYNHMIYHDSYLIWSCNNTMFRVKRCLGCVTNRSKYLTDLPDVHISCPFFLEFLIETMSSLLHVCVRFCKT